MIRFHLPLAALLVVILGCSQPPPQPPISNLPSAQTIYADALDKAQVVKKPVFVVFTQDEFWCHRFDGYNTDEEVARLLDKHFIVIRIWLDATPGGEQLYYDRGTDRGVPAYSIVDPAGNLLADSGDKGQNIGFPNTEEEVKRYLEILKTASPEMTDDELALLQNKLEARRVADATAQ